VNKVFLNVGICLFFLLLGLGVYFFYINYVPVLEGKTIAEYCKQNVCILV